MPKRSHRVYDIVKRLLDLVVAVPLIVLLSPVMAVAAIAVLLADGTPVLFRQARPGKDGRLFTLLKFRTMRAVAEGEDALATDEVRLTRAGRILRATSLDELPQLFNVLFGQMSFVGPRPLLPQYLGRYSPEQARRHEVRPGITGWAQVNGRNATTWEKRFSFDIEYVDRRSLALDARILWMTVVTVLSRQGVSAEDHATMPEYMGTQGNTRQDDEE